MLYLYLDESGDLGFDFVNKKPSKVFTVAILAIKGTDARRHITKMVERTLRKKLNPKGKRSRQVQELKGTSTTLDVKKYFYRNIQDLDFLIYTLTLNKKRVYQSLIEDKARIYNWVARLLLDEIDYSAANTRVHLVIDKSKSKPEIAEFNSYILTQMKGKVDPKIPLQISHVDSCHDLCLNVADLFAWGVFRKYERRDAEWFEIFKGKLKYDNFYLP